MVAASEYGYLELLLVRALPDYQLRFRNLAWEGDTVFEQRRDLNFPPLEEQLDKIGATVVIAQFGQMESLAGKEKLPEFIAAYEKLIERMSGGGKRRLIVLSPLPFDDGSTKTVGDLRNSVLSDYAESIAALAKNYHALFIDSFKERFGIIEFLHRDDGKPYRRPRLRVWTRDGVHLNEDGHRGWAEVTGRMLKEAKILSDGEYKLASQAATGAGMETGLRQIIRAKNRLWFHYWRPQNWAFLNGDRINQPSSRDHLDPSKRWFPDEIEQFVPLIEAKEREIDQLAAKLSKP